MPTRYLRSPLAPVFVGAAVLLVYALWQGIGALTAESPPLPSEWLTEAEQEELAELVSSFRPGEPIAACLWEQRSRSDIADIRDTRPGSPTWQSQTSGGRQISLALITDAEPSGSYDEAEGPGYFCWVPANPGGPSPARDTSLHIDQEAAGTRVDSRR